MSEKMETPSAENLFSVLRYYTGHPREVKPSKVIDLKSERQFVELLHEGVPVVVAFTLRCPWTKRSDRVVEDASSEWYPHIKFMRGETEGGAREGSVTRYSVNVLPFNHDMSPYGFREFFKIHGLS
ncbi:hypothetical protein AXG93_2035s1020 [Marchantia polymorpha subsp. ruderalis]|uniref:Thioredoxin domain-containing protein n=1 Tax=Marchantia polymorpha subsp. ruderalis TaxID=1480154 RepID=A0A176VQZ9_MARPO|nr:hypothetical protein AXG93_2035s1020 [Marchantia polymorpha subsp. ruderalis]